MGDSKFTTPRLKYRSVASVFLTKPDSIPSITGRIPKLRLITALKVLDTFMQTQRPQPSEAPKPFVYISAADAFRPVVPSRYIESKREAELGILQRTQSPDVGIRPLFIRPGEFSCLFRYLITFSLLPIRPSPFSLPFLHPSHLFSLPSLLYPRR